LIKLSLPPEAAELAASAATAPPVQKAVLPAAFASIVVTAVTARTDARMTFFMKILRLAM